MKNTTGTKNYNGIDWFWPHDFRHYLRDANSKQRKLVHNGWLKIGVTVKKSGLKISDRYLQPKKNQLKKAWYIVRKVVAPKELGQPIPESVKEGGGETMIKLKPLLNERMDKRQAGEMLKQLGGNRFIAMTGAKNFGVGPKGASFKIGRNSKNVNYVRIDLKNDLYDMEFIQMRAGKLKVKSKVKQIYADQLRSMFTKHTGMYTSL